jgi:hypothetical protein
MSDKSDINSAIKALKIEEKIKAKKEWLSSWQINFLITIFV